MMINAKRLLDSPATCDDCGLCCMGQNLLPWSMARLDAVELPPELSDELDSIADGPLFGDDGCPCVWLDRVTGKCKHYEHRPTPCRNVLEPGDEVCMRIRRTAYNHLKPYVSALTPTPEGE